MNNVNIEGMYWDVTRAELDAAQEKARPSYLFRPELSIDGDQWCALYGADLQVGVAGFGDSPTEAYAAFDRAWHTKLPTPEEADHTSEPEDKPRPIGKCPECGANWYYDTGFCGGCDAD